MKTFAVSLEAIASPLALHTAWRKYRAGKRRRPAVAAFELGVEPHLLALSAALLAGTWRHGRYSLLEIYDPKPRLIAVATVADRVVHRAVHDALAPRFNRSFLADSFACLEGRGSHRAVWRFAELLRCKRHLVHLDIQRYFPSLDHFVKRKLRATMIRYMDDLVLFADDSAELRRWRGEIAGWLWENRRLRLNPRKGHVRPSSLPQTYLGYRVRREGWDLSSKATRRFRKQLYRLRDADLEKIERYLAGWQGAMRV